MHFSIACLTFIAASAALVTGSPVDKLVKRETSYGNPDTLTDMGDRYRLNYGSPEGHENACPGHLICYITKSGSPKDDVPLGDPDNFVDEGNRYRVNYGSQSGHPNACDGHYICYLPK